MSKVFLDCKGLSCPLPVVKVSQAMRNMKAGDTLEVEATDFVFFMDVKAWASRTGNELVKLEKDSIVKAVIKKV